MFIRVRSLKSIRLAAFCALVSGAAAAAPAFAVTLKEAEQTLAYWQQAKRTYCNGNPQWINLCNTATQAVNYWQAVVNQLRKQPPPSPPAGNDCQQRARLLEQNATAGRTFALRKLSTIRPGRNGYAIYYNEPAPYCQGPLYAASYRYNVNSATVVNEINRLANNRKYIYDIVPY